MSIVVIKSYGFLPTSTQPNRYISRYTTHFEANNSQERLLREHLYKTSNQVAEYKTNMGGDNMMVS
jgi:hypothetical protein